MMSHLCNRCVREFLILARTRFAFGLPSKPGVTRPQQSNLYTEEKVKLYYKVQMNIQSNVQFSITLSFTEIIQMPLKIYAGRPKNSFGGRSKSASNY